MKMAGTRNWSEAIERAKRHPVGQFSDTHGSTLKSLAEAGIAEKLNDDLYYLTDQGWGEDKPAESKVEQDAVVEYTVQDSAMWQLHLDVTGAPDTSHPEHPGGSLRPVGVSLGIGATDGVWSVSAVNVFGQKVKDGKVVTKRNYPLPFLDPLGEDSEAPEWLRKVCQDWVDKANGVSKAAPVQAEVAQISPQRSAFDSALRVLLMRENLDGTEWAIRQLRESADAAAQAAADDDSMRLDKDLMWMTLRVAADELEKLLDKRTAELATREH